MRARAYLYLTVFVSGMTTLAVEFTTSRMLQTVYGTSNLVWANVIGVVLLFLTLGYFVGGWMADRRPFAHIFYTLAAIAGFSSVFFLLLTSVILRSAAAAMATMDIGGLVSSLAAVVLALAVPVTLLGSISPFAVRLAVSDVREAGRISGLIYAVSTWGSLLGTYLPVLLIIPSAGSRWAALIFGSVLLLVGLGGLWQEKGQVARGRWRVAALLLPLILIPTSLAWVPGHIKVVEGQLFETESAYNYIQVIRQGDCNYLLLNEGQAFHSFYCDGGRVPGISVWSIMLAAPFFSEGLGSREWGVGSDSSPARHSLPKMAVIGLAAGTIPKQFTSVFGPLPIDGIEIDPAIVATGQNYFAMNEANLQVIVGDGRYQLNRLAGPYDLITIDAYKVPYIPWHLTTREFFGEVRDRLAEDGVLAINVGRSPEDRRLVEAITATLLAVFPTVHTIDVPGTFNSILVATVQPTSAANLRANLERLRSEAGSGAAQEQPLLLAAMQVAADNIEPTVASDLIFTDNRAPVETIVDTLVIRYLLEAGPSALPSLEQ